MKAMYPLATFFTSLPLMAAEPPPYPESSEHSQSSENSYRLTFKTSNECVVLANKDCKGKRNQLRFEIPSGYFISIEKVADHASAVPYDKIYEFKPVGNLHGRVAWDQHVTGSIARFGKSFQPTERTALNVEAYVGNISGAVSLNSIAEGTAYPLSITIPAFSFENGFRDFEFAGKTISTKGGYKLFSKNDYALSGKSYYGGIKESLGISFSPLKNTHVLMSQFAQAGIDRIGYGAGLGLAYTSGNDNRIGQRSANICQGGDFRSSARFAFVVSACADKTNKSMVYDMLVKNAEPFAVRGNGKIAEAQAMIDKFENKTGFGHTLPTYTGKDVLNGLGITSPYEHINKFFVIAAAVNVGGVTLTVSHHQSLKPSRDGGSVSSITLGKDF